MSEPDDCLNQGNILVVDDQPANLDILVEILKGKGFVVRPVLNGRMAILAAELEPPDLILLDVCMPEMDGYEVCQQIKQDEKLKDIPIIFVSALSETLDIVRAYQVGGVDYVTKPFHLDELEARIKTHLKLHRYQIQKEEERRIREQLEFFQVLVEAIPVPVYYKNFEGVYLGCNSAFVDFLSDVSEVKNKAGVIGKTIFEVLPREIAEPLYRKDIDLLNKGGVQQFESQTSIDNKQRDSIFYKAVINRESTGWRGIVGTILDITERKKMEGEMHRKVFELESVNYISSALRRGNTLLELLDILLDKTLEIFNFPSGIMILHHPDTGKALNRVSRGWMSDLPSEAFLPDQTGSIDYPNRPYSIEDFCKDENITKSVSCDCPAGWRGMALPVQNSQGPIGILAVAFEQPRTLNQSEVQILEIITEIAGNAIQTTQLTDKLHQSNETLRNEVALRGNIQSLLAQEKELLSTTLMSIDDGVICTDKYGRISLYNQAAGQITGYDASQAIGAELENIYNLCDPITGEPLDEIINELLKRDRIEKIDHSYKSPILIAKNGDRKIVSGSISEVTGVDGTLYGFVIVFRDNTEKLKGESHLALSQKMEGIGQLAAGIAHEINTPIQYVGDNLKFLERAFGRYQEMLQEYEEYVQGPLDPTRQGMELDHLSELRKQKKIDHYGKEIPDAVHESLEGIERVRKIVLAIREFSHPSEKDKKYADINHGIQTTITISRNEWKYIAEIETDFAPDLPLVYCHIDEINQVILNMILNSTHAIQEAGAAQNNQGHKGVIRISTRQRGDRVLISIADTGSGIPLAIRDRIFEPFFTTKDVGKGTGQGLYLTHHVIVKDHRGNIEVESEVGKGTTFTIELFIDPIPGQKQET